MPRGPKPAPAAQARPGSRLHEYRPAPGVGWQHGSTPEPPPGLLPVTVDAWSTWFGSWWASFWEPADVPGLELLAIVYDRVRAGTLGPEKLPAYLDRYGLTVKGRQDNRWAEPESGPVLGDIPVDDDLAHRRAGRQRKVS